MVRVQVYDVLQATAVKPGAEESTAAAEQVSISEEVMAQAGKQLAESWESEVEWTSVPKIESEARVESILITGCLEHFNDMV